MQQKLIVRGGEPLYGKITPQGSKNAVLPIIFATVLTRGVSRISNVPDIGDVRVAIELLRELGAIVDFSGNLLSVDTASLCYKKPSEALTSSIRASSYLLGASLSRFGVAAISTFGGCNFDNRPIDMHIGAALSLGASLREDLLVCDRLVGGKIVFKKRSVGATVNAILMAAAAEGTTEIFGAAREPHISLLIEYINRAGGCISVTDEVITVIGAPLFGADIEIIPDTIEAGSYLMLAPMTGGEITVLCPKTAELQSLSELLSGGGCEVIQGSGELTVRGRIKSPLTVNTAPYPGYPTDLQPQSAPLMAVASGGVITETVWSGRFGYLCELSKFGILSSISPSMAYIFRSDIRAASAECPDLRGGAAVIMAALAARGESEIKKPETVFRGYENLVKKLRSLGADIK